MTIMRSPEETEAAAEDREYFAVDLFLPADQRCGHVGQIIVGVTRTCSRRAGHVNDRHRDGEISWTDANAPKSVDDAMTGGPNTDPAHRVYGDGGEQPCQWFAKCANPANGLRPHPILTQVPICCRCDAKVERLST